MDIRKGIPDGWVHIPASAGYAVFADGELRPTDEQAKILNTHEHEQALVGFRQRDASGHISQHGASYSKNSCWVPIFDGIVYKIK